MVGFRQTGAEGAHWGMTYPQHWLLQFGGHQGDPNEEWSCGIRMAFVSGGGGGIGDPINEEDFLDEQAIPALQTWFEDTQTKISNAAHLLTIKFNEIRPDGHYFDQTQTHQRQVNWQGGVAVGNNTHPLQVAMVLSWRSNEAARGPATHGRIYMPRPTVAIDAGGDVLGADRVSVCGTTATMLNTLDTTPGGLGGDAFRPHIVSALGSGLSRQIDRVVVDSCLDIQRRRAKSQSKEVTSAPVTY